jgi:hypothetical protein
LIVPCARAEFGNAAATEIMATEAASTTFVAKRLDIVRLLHPLTEAGTVISADLKLDATFSGTRPGRAALSR